jgi:SAM-dependent methyltransferase
MSFAAEVVGVDLGEEPVRMAMQQWQDARETTKNKQPGSVSFCIANAYNLPFADGSFDVIIFSEVLEHLPDYMRALIEVRRVLRPCGLLGISVPSEWPEKLCWMLSSEYAAQPGGHVRIFKRDVLLRETHALGLNCYYRHRAHALHSVLWWLKCLFWKNRERALLVRMVHRLLVWQMMQAPRALVALEHMLNPLCGKSEVLYFYNKPTVRWAL